MDAPGGGGPPGSGDGVTDDGATDDGATDDGATDDGATQDADLVVDVLHRIGRCPLRSLLGQPELVEWTPVRLERAVVRAWNGGLVFIDRNDDLVAL